MRFFAALLGLVLASTVALAGRLTVTGEGSVSLEPDQGLVTFSMSTYDPFSSVAINSNAQSMKGLREVLSGLGIKDKEVQTVQFSLEDNYKTIMNNNHEQMVKDGFVVRHVLKVDVCDLSKMGQVIDALSNHPVPNRGDFKILGIGFASSKSKEATDQARIMAVKNAMKKAQDMADALGVKLGNVAEVNENSPMYSGRVMYAESAAMPRGGAPGSEISGGTLNFRSNVAIQWNLVPAETFGNRKELKHDKIGTVPVPKIPNGEKITPVVR